jgi:hypothetical protein
MPAPIVITSAVAGANPVARASSGVSQPASTIAASISSAQPNRWLKRPGPNSEAAVMNA